MKAWRDPNSGDMCFQFQDKEFATLVGLVNAGVSYYESIEIPRIREKRPGNEKDLMHEVRSFSNAFREMVATRNIAPQLLEGGKVKEVHTS